MKKKIVIFAICFISLNGCHKQPIENVTSPTGKWESIAFKENTSWQPEVTPHHFEIREDNSYTFRDHNGILCTGKVSASETNNVIRLYFYDADCGLTDRNIMSLSRDTLELSVVTPPNITHDKVKYVREK